MTTPSLSSILRHTRPIFKETLRAARPTLQNALPNGFRIASESKDGDTCTVGVWIDAGSRWETEKNNGVAHFLEHMNFKGTGKRSRQDIEFGMEKMGAHLNAYTSREHTCYYVKCFKKDVPEAVDILADILLNSKRTEQDLDAERQTIVQEKEDVEARIDEVLMDHLHSAAFEGSGLGLSILGPLENIQKSITKGMIDDFVKTHYTGPRMALVGSGAVDHGQLCDLASKYFGALPTGQPKPSGFTRFLGGDKRETNQLNPLTHVAVAFQTPGISHPDAIKIKVLEQLLGSYSRDKGEAAYSCFARAIVMDFYDPKVGQFFRPNKAGHNPIHSLNAFWAPYSDVGLLGFYAIAEPGKSYGHEWENILHYAMRELIRVSRNISEEEFERAKNQLKLQTMLQLDGTTNIADDIGRQVLSFGARVPLASFFEQLDAISREDLIRVGPRVLLRQGPRGGGDWRHGQRARVRRPAGGDLLRGPLSCPLCTPLPRQSVVCMA
uniref:Ubiquinol-cytochrome-c reductase complex core protein I, mitochondrial n=1 Tax=Euglena gracilis TaxID=3039 RepID=QCR1_EUGGR|nr:RecName: Full=Ubiquinol-cytochrome-c reductase complex core protein I, mitochondrial; Flags: Precursor [Euglena gracilis]